MADSAERVDAHQTEVRISAVVMHHPRRASRIAGLVRGCAPLDARVVVDPDPRGVPSPLRTAKQAWAQIAAGATHHLVLQDDVQLAPDFAAAVTAAVASHPTSGVALYSHWDSPQNSYLVRRAAVVGSAWAPLSHWEWTPTQGLVLPVTAARHLAAYLADIPDEVRDDDEMVVKLCRQIGLPVLATLPHLVDHGADETIVGHEGAFHATAFAPHLRLGADHWRAREQTERALAQRCDGSEHAPYAVEFTGSRCRLRLFRPGTAEPVEHHFGWYWRDWCELVGIDPGAVLRDCEAYLDSQCRRPAPLALVTEVWAAGFLLGADTARTVTNLTESGLPAKVRAGLVQAVMATWIRSGVAQADRAHLDEASRRVLIDVGVAAIASAWINRSFAWPA